MSENVFNLIVHDLIGMQFASMNTQAAVAASNTLLTTSNQALTENWTSCDESNPKDPGYTAWYYLQIAAGKSVTGKPKPANPPSGASGIGNGGINKWITVFLKSTTNHCSDYSSAFMTQVYSVYGAWRQAHPKSKLPNEIPMISNFTNLLQAAAQAGEQTGQNGITLLNSLAQHFETDQGPVSQATSTLLDGYNNYSSAMSQISA